MGESVVSDFMAGLIQFNSLPEQEARKSLLRCCGSRRWVCAMLENRPFSSETELLRHAARVWSELSREDFLEAFAHHPRIGGNDARLAKFAETKDWAQGEQSGAEKAPKDILASLAAGNAQYEQRFGYLFIVCATGKSAEEMLGLLRARLSNSPEPELKIAAAEQAKITTLRLKKLLAG